MQVLWMPILSPASDAAGIPKLRIGEWQQKLAVAESIEAIFGTRKTGAVTRSSSFIPPLLSLVTG
jgi:hypothetical protein